MNDSTDKGSYFFFKSPLGPLLLAEKDGYLVRIDFTERSNTRISSSLTEGFKEAENPNTQGSTPAIGRIFPRKKNRF